MNVIDESTRAGGLQRSAHGAMSPWWKQAIMNRIFPYIRYFARMRRRACGQFPYPTVGHKLRPGTCDALVDGNNVERLGAAMFMCADDSARVARTLRISCLVGML
jgi:hypothetical protein